MNHIRLVLIIIWFVCREQQAGDCWFLLLLLLLLLLWALLVATPNGSGWWRLNRICGGSGGDEADDDALIKKLPSKSDARRAAAMGAAPQSAPRLCSRVAAWRRKRWCSRLSWRAYEVELELAAAAGDSVNFRSPPRLAAIPAAGFRLVAEGELLETVATVDDDPLLLRIALLWGLLELDSTVAKCMSAVASWSSSSSSSLSA